MLADEEKCIEKLFSLVDDSETILIKPHPRDSLGKYDTVVEKFSNVQVFYTDFNRKIFLLYYRKHNLIAFFTFFKITR